MRKLRIGPGRRDREGLRDTMTKLSVNVNKVATLRNTRPLGIPSVTHAARICLEAGAHGITVHPRPDQRHIRPDDVYEIAELLKKFPEAEFNIEGNPFLDFLQFAERTCPAQCTLVPDNPEAATSDHGWKLDDATARVLQPIVEQLKKLGSRVSLFVDADSDDVKRAADVGADRIELYTEPYAAAFARGDARAADAYVSAAETARGLGMGVNAGHDLNLLNLPDFVRQIPYVEEVSIGHALVADALEFGLAATVRKYIAAANPS
jgi:pyridoxine 5-phosphate synthase